LSRTIDQVDRNSALDAELVRVDAGRMVIARSDLVIAPECGAAPRESNARRMDRIVARHNPDRIQDRLVDRHTGMTSRRNREGQHGID